MSKTRSTEEAMQVLNAYRQFLIAYGRYVATEICRHKGSVHSREVRQVLAARGFLEDVSIGDYWLGAVFNSTRFRWTGQWHVYSDVSRNIHERTIKIWELPKGAPGYEKPTKKALPPGWMAHPQNADYCYKFQSGGGCEVKSREELMRIE